MRFALAALVAAGCNQTYGLSSTELVDAPPDTVTYCFADNFDDSVIDPARWTEILPGAPALVVESGGELRVEIGMGVNSYNGLVSVPFDMSGGTVQAKLGAAYLPGFTDVEFVLGGSVLSNFLMTIGGNKLNMISIINNNRTADVQLPYDPIAHAYVRYRHDRDAKLMHFETSPDAVTWTARRSSPMPYEPTGAQLTLLAGGFQSPPEASTGRYDDIVVHADHCVTPAE